MKIKNSLRALRKRHRNNRVVRRRGRHTWTVAVAAPLDRSLAVGRMLALAYEALACERAGTPRHEAPDVSFVVTPRAGGR